MKSIIEKKDGFSTESAHEFYRLMSVWRFAQIGDDSRVAFDAVVKHIDRVIELESNAASVPTRPRQLPAEPTEDMLNAARDWAVKKYGIGIGNDAAIGCWKAMFAAVPAASVQPDPLADTRLADAVAEIKYWKQKAVASGACKPDIGGDAALVEAARLAYVTLTNSPQRKLDDGSLAYLANGYVMSAFDALFDATQAAPEVASLPPEVLTPRWSCNGCGATTGEQCDLNGCGKHSAEPVMPHERFCEKMDKLDRSNPTPLHDAVPWASDCAELLIELKDSLAERGARPVTNKYHTKLWDRAFAMYQTMFIWANPPK